MSGEWAAQLAGDLKENEAFTGLETITDFGNRHLETLGKVSELDGSVKTLEGEKTDLEGRLANSIPKLGEEPNEEQVTAYRNAMGIPEKPEDYEFPPTEGVEHDETTTNWARGIFHQAGLTKEQGALISQSWDALLAGIEKAEGEAREKAEKEADDKLRAEWGAGYDGNLELIRRGWKHFTDSEFDAFAKETGIGNNPLLIRFIFKIGKAMGEDFTPPATPRPGDPDAAPGMQYDSMDHFKD